MRLALALSVALAMSAPGSARAELPPPTCVGGWWAYAAAVPLTVTGAPQEPWILLPIRWDGPGTPEPHDLVPPVLTVTVTDAAGTVVPGAVSLRPADATPDAQTLRSAPRWRPDAPLGPGADYTMRVTVPRPTDSSGYTGCFYGAVDRTVSVSVAAAPLTTTPVLSVRVRTWDIFDALRYAPCAELPGGTACEHRPEVCCEGTARGVRVTLGFDAPLPNGGAYHAVALTVTGEAAAAASASVHPAGDGETDALFDPLSSGLPAPETVCVTAVVYDLFTDDAVANAVSCADPADHVPADPAGASCYAGRCAAVDLGPDASDGDVLSGDADGDAWSYRVPNDCIIEDTAPSGSGGPSGCGGGVEPAALGLAALALVARSRRRSRAR